MSLIPADNAVAAVAALFVIAAAGFLMEKTRIGALLTGAVWAILFAIIASNIGLIPQDSPGYGFVFTYFVPILIPLFLMKADLKKIFFETGRMTLAFLLASLGTVLGAILAFSLIDIGENQAAAAGTFTATYIGGSVNYAALVDLTGLARNDPNFVSSATAVDNLFSGLFLAMLAVLPGWHWLARRFVTRDHSKAEIEVDASEPAGKATAATLLYSAAFALVVLALGDLLTGLAVAQWGEAAGNWRYAIITVLALIPATAFPKTMASLHGGYELGIGLSFVFFAAIAAGADVIGLVQTAPILIALIAILLTVHAIVTFGLGSILKFSLPELITASNAAILGATTAPALAAAKGWKDLVTPGVLVGVFGYAIGTVIATAVYQFWPG
ncbi:DUF819 family protein [uncultured Maricaulis sp.]|uniref:DUF819 family protein n=1 Tax=uncultured Maricaulis sp. TaxID=174710 RepID=UPI0030DDC36C|tara:strand:- start:2401 stop:3555 length:1155 start_codon:yes stop_codon:yes gene_type:complete